MRLMKFAVLGIALLLTATSTQVRGQTAPLEAKQQAVMVFDFRLDLLRDSPLAKSLHLSDQIAAAMAQQGDDAMDPTTISRIFGAMSAPENMTEAQSIGDGGEMPLDFFVKIQFNDAAAATAALEKLLAKGGDSFERDGKTYYRPPADANAPPNAVLRQFDATTLEMGTEAYVCHPTQQVFTPGLTSAWKMVPENQTIRLAMDLEGAKELLSEAVEQGKQTAPPMAVGFLELVDNMKNLRLSIDLSGANLLNLQATAVDSENAVELQGGLDALMGMAKMGAGAAVNQIKQQDAESAAVLEKVLNSMKPKTEGNEVSVIVPKPDGFDAAVAKIVQQMQQMQGGGAPMPQN